MPNWVMGNCEIIGKEENVKKFLANHLELVDYAGDELDDIIVDGNIYRTPALKGYHAHYIKDTNRCFIEPFVIDFDELERRNGKVVLDLYIRGAWFIESAPLVDISKKYHIMFLIEAEEEFSTFEQVICASNGKLIEDKRIEL